MDKLLELPRRFFRKEKNRFLDTVGENLAESGYDFERINFGSIIKSINLETKSVQPEFVFMAHYDTGTIMPFWFSWLLKIFGVNNQWLMIIIMCFFINLLSILGNFHISFNIAYWIIFISFFIIVVPNKRNFDDNTSGVIALLSLAGKCKENNIDNVKFIFIDNEELGLFGSRAHRKYMEKMKTISPDSKIISLDCVGVGKTPLIIKNSKSKYESILFKNVKDEFELCKIIKMIMPLSDNFSFRKYGALNISFADKAIIPFGYSLSKIHSSKDNFINLQQIERLTDVLINFIKENTINNGGNEC